MRLCFWNVSGLSNKCEETWKYLERFDVLGFTETYGWKKRTERKWRQDYQVNLNGIACKQEERREE